MVDKKQMLAGAIVGLIVPVIAFALWILALTDYSLEEAVALVVKGGLYSEVLSLSAISNMLVLYLFLNKNRYFAARGVLMITIVLSLITVLAKLI